MDEPRELDESNGPVRLHVSVRGAVQGVGFRPFVYRLASELGLRGWVENSVTGVQIEVEGSRVGLERFLKRLEAEKPVHCLLLELASTWLSPAAYAKFEIRQSHIDGAPKTLVLPDIATCPDCLKDIRDPANRRFRYPFTNCTRCGPRFTIIRALPYDRERTSMQGFRMCALCEAEYHDPESRRFHAQPNACPTCGPRLELWDSTGRACATGEEALVGTPQAIEQGAIVAVKGLGGFHLLVAAHQDDSIQRLRGRKHREEKPFALMFGSLSQVQHQCEVSPLELQLLTSPAAPIVLVRARRTLDRGFRISTLVAPGNPWLGVMLPSTPLHHLLLDQLQFPVVATSGNLVEEPICIDEREALTRLAGLADLFLVHNRPIVRHADDSIVRVVAERELMLRRARGYAPLPISIASSDMRERDLSTAESPVLAVGAHLKNTIALAVGSEVFVSQHIGDLETMQAHAAFAAVIEDFQQFYQARPKVIAADAHPDYLSTRYARRTGERVISVQHHYAHVLSCMAEHDLASNVLGVAWDGTGYGTDQTIWGGEFLTLTPRSYARFAHLRTFPLPGGEQAVKEPRRSALGLLYAAYGEAAFEPPHPSLLSSFEPHELRVLRQMMTRGVNAPATSSAGRLFDGIAALIGLRKRSGFEGQAAMDLEFACDGVTSEEAYPVRLATAAESPGTSQPSATALSRAADTGPATTLILDWLPWLDGVLNDLDHGVPVGMIAVKFHNSLIEGMVEIARRTSLTDVVLSGGCFQNKYLIERAVLVLRRAGFRPHWHRWIPPNDGGIALGQVMAARRVPV